MLPIRVRLSQEPVELRATVRSTTSAYRTQLHVVGVDRHRKQRPLGEPGSDVDFEETGHAGWGEHGAADQAVSGAGDCGPDTGRGWTLPNVRRNSSSRSSTVASRRTPSVIRSGVG
jgi:hypothetical protein